MIRLLIGGSPCTYWSIAQKNNRETVAGGLGWELFKNYLIAKEKWKPDYFLYENNKSASHAIKEQIKQELGVTPQDEQISMFYKDNGVRFTYINSALVSAQNRQRFYVTNFGDIEQPEDRGIYLDTILTPEDFYPYNGGDFIRIKDDLSEHYNGCWQIGCTGKSNGQAVRVYDIRGKSVTLKSQAGGGGGKTGLYFYNGKVYSLNARGCEKLQTIPKGYTDCVPKETAISLLGNGWTVEVIKYLLSYIPNITKEPIEVLSMYDGMSCGQIALKEMGCNVVRYTAYEIDKYAIKTTMANFPNTIQKGDAFAVREKGWWI